MAEEEFLQLIVHSVSKLTHDTKEVYSDAWRWSKDHCYPYKIQTHYATSTSVVRRHISGGSFLYNWFTQEPPPFYLMLGGA